VVDPDAAEVTILSGARTADSDDEQSDSEKIIPPPRIADNTAGSSSSPHTAMSGGGSFPPPASPLPHGAGDRSSTNLQNVNSSGTSPNRRLTNNDNIAISTSSKNVKGMKPDKPHGPPPFEYPTVDRFELTENNSSSMTSDAEQALTGLQLSLRLCNVCGYQDKLFVVIFGSGPLDNSSVISSSAGGVSTTEKAQQSGTLGGAALAAADNGGVASSRWIPLSRTEVCVCLSNDERQR
jgi:hypothetical protein